MKSLRLFNRRAGSVFAAAALVLSTAVPGMATAATVTERSIELSSSTVSATGVDYHLQFTAKAASTGAFVVDFCDSAAVGTACTPPAGLSTASIATTGGGNTFAAINTNAGVKVTLGTPVTTGNPVDVTISGVTNPSSDGVFYARIVTYQDATTNYNYTDPATLGAHLDQGSVALSATDGFGVSGSVAETMTFCVSGPDGSEANPITTNCGGTLTAPDITLGDDGALGYTMSTGTIFTQISTNAVGGAVVSLKSDAAGCGGLLRDGTGTAAQRCGIAPLTVAAATIADNAAAFGLKLGTLGGDTGTTVAAAGYDTSNFFIDYDADDEATGVTSAYGDPVYTTNGAPVSDGTADLTFGANISPVTPAGTYSAKFSLIATGTF